MTKIITICGVDEELADAMLAEIVEMGLLAQVEDDEAPRLDAPGINSAGPVHDPNAYRFERIERLARDLLIATQEREGLTSETKVNKLEALACFWVAANFDTVRSALLHSFGDDQFPVGKNFDDFVKSFLGEEAYDKL